MSEAKAAAVRKAPRYVEGIVKGAKCAKTISVDIEYRLPHPRYGKFVRRVTRYYAHDEKDEAKEGDRVRLVACRPLSKTKHFRLVRVLEKARG